MVFEGRLDQHRLNASDLTIFFAGGKKFIGERRSSTP
jgi:hypothetical protein